MCKIIESNTTCLTDPHTIPKPTIGWARLTRQWHVFLVRQESPMAMSWWYLSQRFASLKRIAEADKWVWELKVIFSQGLLTVTHLMDDKTIRSVRAIPLGYIGKIGLVSWSNINHNHTLVETKFMSVKRSRGRCISPNTTNTLQGRRGIHAVWYWPYQWDRSYTPIGSLVLDIHYIWMSQGLRMKTTGGQQNTYVHILVLLPDLRLGVRSIELHSGYCN
jgi:hypothetical protein